MAPLAEALPKSESKKNFLDRIGLGVTGKDGRLYETMKREASEGRSRIIEAMKAEGPGSGLGPASFSPEGEEFFPSSHIADQILSDEAVRVYACASTDTRRIYDLAFDPDRPNDPNWIIRWFLWHVFRYRDGRQARQKHQRPKARPSRPFPYCGSKEDVRRNAMLYESASRDSCPRSWRPYTNDLFRTASTHQHYKVAAQKPYFDFGRSYYDDRHSHYTTSPPTPPMRTVDKHRFSASSGISKTARRSGLPYDPVREAIA